MQIGNTNVVTEINIDGIIGPSHHYGGLGVGNIASLESRNSISNPKEAALEGIAKMEFVASLGVGQFYLPPPDRPNWTWLESLGYDGDRRDALRRCADDAPSLLSAAYSSSFMWTANAATVASSCDTTDRQLHIVPANLCCNLHRGQEALERRDQLHGMFAQVKNAIVHAPIPSVFGLRDEGAANHMRLCGSDGQKAIHIFVYGPSSESSHFRFTPRQSELSSRSVANRLKLNVDDCIFVQQTATAISAGVFHNDVIAMSHRNVLIYHEDAFEDSDAVMDAIQRKFERKVGEPLISRCVKNSELPLEEAVRTYLFNSQLLTTKDGQMLLLSPSQCERSEYVQALVQSWIADSSNPIAVASHLALDQSMRNGGGPACLRLRATLNDQERSVLGLRNAATPQCIELLRHAVIDKYPTSVSLSDLARIEFAEYCQAASRSIARI